MSSGQIADGPKEGLARSRFLRIIYGVMPYLPDNPR
jgi:hypothetical protein